MKQHFIKIFLFSILLKITYFGFALLIAEIDNGQHSALKNTTFLSTFKRNDSYWYQKAAEEGYPKIHAAIELGYSNDTAYQQSVWAQFPMYPFSVRGVEKVFHLNFEVSAFILSLVFATSSFIAFYLLGIFMFKLKQELSFVYTLLFMVFPFHYYFSMYYTEAAFFSCLGFAFISIAQKKYYLLSLLLVPLTLLRPNGIVCALPLFLYSIEVEGGYKNYLSNLRQLNWKKIWIVFYFISAPIALAAYCLYQKEMTNYYLAFVMAQAGWYKEFMFPFFGLFRRSELDAQFNSIYTIAAMLISIIGWRKFSVSEQTLIWLSILLPLTSGSAACMPRYLSVVFPLSIYLATVLLNNKWRYYIIAGAFLLQLLTFYPWLIADPFSY